MGVESRSSAISRLGLYLATFMAVFDIAVVFLALPAMEKSIGAGIADQQWIASAYGLMEAGFTLAAGTLADLWGRKRVYLFGVSLFVLASIASGLAPSPGFLITSRFLQGIGGAIAMALPLAILVSTTRDAKQTESVIRTYATIAGLGAVTAPALGGILVQTLGWRAIFFVNVPISLFVLYAGVVHTRESPRDPSRRLDLGGQITSALALLALSFAAIEGNALGWTSPTIFGAIVLSIASAIAFVVIERRVPMPMIRFGLLRQPVFATGVCNLFLINLGFFTVYLIASLFLQNVQRLDALHAGWLLLANNLAFFLTNQFGGPIVARLGLRAAAIVGSLCGVVGVAMFATFGAQTPQLVVAVPLALTGIGWGLAFTPYNTLAMGQVAASETGLASGLLGLGRPLGAVLGTAVFGSVIAASMTSYLGTTLVAFHLPVDVAARIAAALHHGGLWVLSGTSPAYGLPLGTLRVSLDAGFVTGMHRAAIIAAILLCLGVVYAARAFARRATFVAPAPPAATEPSGS